MGNGENIYKRKDGKWVGRYVRGHDLAGNPIYGYCYGKTYQEVSERIMECRLFLLSGTSKDEKRFPAHRMDFCCDAWLSAARSRVKDSTYIKYEFILNRHLRPEFGWMEPEVITPEMVNSFSRELMNEKGLAPKTTKDILVILKAILRYSGINIDFSYPKDVRNEMRILTMDEQKLLGKYLLDNLDSRHFGIYLALNTGMRVGELCALRWGDISFTQKTLRINYTMQRLKSLDTNSSEKTCVVIGSTKSETSCRTIPLTDHLMELCQIMYPGDNEAYILTGNSKFVEPRCIQRTLKQCADECGIEDIHFHTLRHTFATRCVEVGFEIKSLSEILGHSSTTITLNRYVHSSMRLKRDNMKKLAALGLWPEHSKPKPTE